MQTLYQYKPALPYMGCCTLPASTTKAPKHAETSEREYWLQNEKILRSTIQQTTKAWLHSPQSIVQLLLKMKSGRPIMFQIKLIYTR